MISSRTIAFLSLSIITGVSSRNCSYGGWSHKFYKDSCCDNEAYELGHGLWEYGEECYHQPIDDNLPYQENHWIFYECVVNKTLQIGTNELTEVTFMEMMSKNMSPAKRQGILNLQKAGPLKIVNSNGNFVSNRLKLKMFWLRYFTLEFAICGKVIINRCGKNQVCLSNARRDYEPEMFCRPSNSARTANVCKFTKQEFEDCMEAKTAILKPLIRDGPEAPKMILDRAHVMCRLIASSRFDPDVEFAKPNCDFQALFNSIIPQFASTSSRNLLLENCRKLMARRDIVLDDSPQPFKNFVNNFNTGSGALGANEVFLINLDAAMMLVMFADKTQELTCFKQWE